MKKEFILKGLDCANCASKIETAVKSLDGVTYATCNALNSKLIIESEGETADGLFERIQKIVHKYEPDVEVIAKEKNMPHSHSHAEHEGRGQIIQFIIGVVIFLTALIMSVFFDIPYLFLALYLLSYVVLGYKVVIAAGKTIIKGRFLDENFLMTAASIGAFAIGEYPEAVAVMLFYLIGEFFQGLAVKRSKKSIADLMDIRPGYANIKDESGEIVRVPPESVKIGEIIIVKPGEKIPLDGTVLSGESMLDTKALTGESVPRSVKAGNSVLSGCINSNGVLTIEVTKEFAQSTVAKIIELVENAGNKKARTENFITGFAKYYTPLVVFGALLLAVIPSLITKNWAEWINRALVFLVISCPCALVVSVPLGFFGGIGGASKIGVLVKGGNYLDALSKLDTVVFDKTGTLTLGVFEVTESYPAEGFSKDELLKLAAQAEAFSNHPIAQSILKAYNQKVDKESISDYAEIAGHGISVIADGKKILAGNGKLMDKENIAFTEITAAGTKVYVAAGGVYAGCIVISDEVKSDSRAALASLKKLGIKKTVMLTGDNKAIAETVAKELGIDEVYSELLPGDKVDIVEKLSAQKTSKGKLAFVGDGINDAPVLARSDIGIAMGGLGSDAAIEAADIVLMTDEPSKIAGAVKISKRTKRIVWQNIIFALAVKGIFLALGAFGIAGMWEAVFADVGVSLLAVLNSLRAMRHRLREH